MCPYCGKEMILGYIHGDRYKLKWVSSEDPIVKYTPWFAKGIPLTDFTTSSRIDTYYCKDDEIFIIKNPGL
jgi:hypothetical protein